MRYLTPKTNFFDEAFDEMLQPFFYAKSNAMKTDISETEKGYLLDMELAGFDKKDIDISYNKGYLTVTANRNEEKEDNKKGYICRERKSGSVSRSFYLGDVAEDTIKASFVNGVLTIDVDKQAKIDTTKKISIE